MKQKLRIMSFNLLCGGPNERSWPYRTPLAVRTIYNLDPDTLGVQEAHIGWMHALKACLPHYDCIGVGRDDGKEEGEFSAVFYKKDKFELIDSGSFWLSETPDRPGKGWDAACIRICSWAKLRDIKTKKVFVHLNTHLDHRGRVAMQKGAELVAARGREISGPDPAFFTGDFNVTPNSEPHAAVLEGGFFDCRDAAEVTDRDITWHDLKPISKLNPGEVIDYVFAKGDVTVKKFAVVRDRVDGDLPSDHYPVYADVEF